MYLFVRDRWGGVAGVVSAAALVLAPYIVYVDPHARGDAPETFAIAMATLMLWAFARLRRGGRLTASPGDMVLAAITLAAVIVSHNLMAIIFFGVLLAWLAWDMAFGPRESRAVAGASTMNEAGAVRERDEFTHDAQMRWKVIASLSAAVCLGLGLAAVMWLPAVLERDAIQFRNVAGGPGTYFDFHRFFVEPRELFAPALTFDLGATQMPFRHSVGVAQWVLALLGALTAFSPRTRRLSTLFFALVAVVLLYLMLPASTQVWEAIPPMAFLQFPTRLLGPAAVVLAILAGAAVSWAQYLRWRWSQSALGALAVAACLAGALPLLYPPPWPDFGPVTALRILDTELHGRGIGTTSANDFLPVGVIAVPAPKGSLVDSYKTGLVDKVNRFTLPEGTAVDVLEHGPEHDRFRVTGRERFVFRIYTFYFPGWKAYVDGVETPVEIAEPDGWITFWVPEGDHEVLVRLENTPVRWAGWALTAISGVALMALAAWRVRLPNARRTGERLNGERAHGERLAWRPALLLGAVMVGAMGVRYAADRLGWWRVHSTGVEVLVAQHQHFARLERDVALLAYDLPITAARAGDQVPVTLYWKAMSPLTTNLRVFVHFIGPDGQLWGQSDKWNPADFIMTLWPLDRYVRDEHMAQLRADAPPGQYLVVAGLWDGETGERMRVLDAGGHLSGADGVVLATTLTVRP
jgi:hypothetical protein